MLHWSGNVTIMVLHMLHTKHNGGNACICGGIFPQDLVMSGLSTTDQATKASKELIQIMNNPGPKQTSQSERSNYTPLIYWQHYLTTCNQINPKQKLYLGKCQQLHLQGCRSNYQHQRWWHLGSQWYHRRKKIKTSGKWMQCKITNCNIRYIGTQTE